MVKQLIKGSRAHKRASLKNTPFSDVALEKKFIGGIVKFPNAAKAILNQLNAECLSSDKTKWIYDAIIEFFNKTGFIFDNQAFEEYLKTQTAKKRNIYTKLWKSINKAGLETSEPALFLLRDQLENLYHARILIYNSSLMADKLERYKIDGNGAIKQAIDQYGSIKDELVSRKATIIVVDPIEKFEDFKKFHIRAQKNPKKYKGVPTGIKPLDKRFSGIRDAEFAIAVAVTGVGKSIFLLDVATHCYEHHGDVIYVTIEMPELQIRQRFYCRLSKIKYKFFRNFELSKKHWRKLEHKVKNKFENHPYNFHIVDMPGSGTVTDIKNKIEEITNKNPNVRTIFVDYMNIVRCNSGALAVDWQSQIEIAVELKQLARYFNKGTWSAAQLTAKTQDKQGPIKIRDLSLSKNIPDHIDFGLYIQETETTNVDGMFRMGFIKTRDFSGDEFLIQGDRDRMTFNTVSKKKEKEFYREDLGGIQV